MNNILEKNIAQSSASNSFSVNNCFFSSHYFRGTDYTENDTKAEAVESERETTTTSVLVNYIQPLDST
jgi:hypothetical protein